ncbi:MAG: hypothetical protein WCP55_21290, partial [Lentisphaerota bacterium]
MYLTIIFNNMKKSILSILLVLTMLGAMGQSQISELSKNLVFRWEGSEWNPYRDMVSGTLGTATATYNVLDRQGSGRREVVYNGSTSYTTPPTTITFTESNAWTVIYKGTFKTFGWLFFHNGYNTGITDHSSKLSFKNDATNFYDFNATIASVSNISDKTLTFVANGSGGLSLYIDGVFSQTITGISGGTAITCDRLINSGFSGSISLVRIFNYALTPTQIANYSKPEYPIEWVDRGATGALNVSTTINHNYTSFTATSASAFSAVSNGSGLHLGGTADEINYLLGKIYRAKFTLTLNSGTAPQFGPDATISGAQGLTSAYVAAVNGVNQTDFIITTAATGVMLFFNNSSATNYSVSGLSVTQLGCVLDLNASG